MNQTSMHPDLRDQLAEVLKDLVVGQEITKERAQAALAQHNKSHASTADAAKEAKKAKAYRSIENCRSALQNKDEEIDRLRRQLVEERSRLSKVAGEKMSANNPDLADLSDPYRPTRLVESFTQSYDDEWTQAYEDLQRTTTSERYVIETLANILKEAEVFCEDAANQQLQRMIYQNQLVVNELSLPRFIMEGCTDPVVSHTQYELNNHEEAIVRVHVKQLRKSLARTSISGLTQVMRTTIKSRVASKFIQIRPWTAVLAAFERLEKSPQNYKGENVFNTLAPSFLIGSSSFLQIFAKCYLSKLIKSNIEPCDGINNFVKRTIELVWMMKIQDTPMVLTWAKSQDTFDRNQYSQYTRKGRNVDYAVWPGVLLHKEGPLMSKGIVQCKD